MTGDSLLETERLRLRAVTVDDADLMLAVWNDPAFIRNVADRGIRTLEQAREAIKAGTLPLFAEYGYGPYGMSLKSDGTQIGICGLFRRENLDDPDIGFAVLPDYCGKGYAGEAAAAVVDYARHSLGIETLKAIVSPTNAASIGLIEKLGLTFERMITMPGDDTAIRLYSKSFTDWRKLREFAAVDLTRSYILSWHTEAGTLFIDVDVFLTPEHPFYEKPRPAEKVCIRPAIVEFPFCNGITIGDEGPSAPAEIAERLGAGKIAGLLRHEGGVYELTGDFGTVHVAAERPILRLKGP